MARKSRRELAGAVDQGDIPVTVIDVARVAGVSPITVSRALHRPERVSEATRERVLEVVKAMGYVPNLLAGSLASSKSRLVLIWDRVMDKRTFIVLVEAGEPLIKQAVDAMRKFHDAEAAGLPAVEIDRLRLFAESLFGAVSDYQLRVMAKLRGQDLPPLH